MHITLKQVYSWRYNWGYDIYYKAGNTYETPELEQLCKDWDEAKKTIDRIDREILNKYNEQVRTISETT